MVGAVGVQEHLAVPCGQPVAAFLGGALGAVAGDVAGGGLLLEPLAGVAGGDAGGGGDLDLGAAPRSVSVW